MRKISQVVARWNPSLQMALGHQHAPLPQLSGGRKEEYMQMREAGNSPRKVLRQEFRNYESVSGRSQ